VNHKVTPLIEAKGGDSCGSKGLGKTPQGVK